MTWTAATAPTTHPLTQTRLDIRLNPSRGDGNRPFSPGSSLSGDIALVVDNESGIKDVKHKLSVAEVTVRVFWEARTLTESVHSQEFHRGSSVFVPLTSGQEDVLLMPGAQGGESVEASWAFEITLPEKSTVEDSFNSSSKDRGKSSPIHLAAGPPPSFVGQGFCIEWIIEANVVFADGVASTEVDERGHRVAGELELVERKTFPFRPDGERVLVSNEFQQKDWTKSIEVFGPEEKALGSLNVSVHPPPLPIPSSLPSIPLDINVRLTPPNKVEKKEKKGLFGLGKKKEEHHQSAPSTGLDAFVIESITAKLVIVTTGEPDITLSELATLNISSNHPTLSSSHGLTTEIHLDLASRAPSNWDATLGSFTLPNASRQFLFSLTLALSSPANPRSHPIVLDLSLPFIGAPYQPAALPPPISTSGTYEEPLPSTGDPPSFDGQPPAFEGEPPAFGDQPPTLEAVGGSSGGPPGYM